MPRTDDLQWLSEGVDDHQVARSSKSGSSMMHKLTSPLRRLSNTTKRSSQSGSTDGGGGGGGKSGTAAMSKTGGNPFAGAAFSTLPSLPESARSFTEGMSTGRRPQLQMSRAQSHTLPQAQPAGGRLPSAAATSSSPLPRISAADEGSRRTSANGTGRVSSGGGVAETDMAPHKRTFTKTSMQGMMSRITGGGGSRLSATGDAPPAAPQRIASPAPASPAQQPAAASTPRVATPKAHVGEALRAQRAPPPPLTPAQKDAARLQALQEAARPKPKGPAASTDPLTGDLFADVPLEAMTGLKRSASPHSGAATPAATTGPQVANPFSEYSAALSGKSARSAADAPPYSAAGSTASVRSAGPLAPNAASTAGNSKPDGKAAGGIAPLQISASAAGASSTASRWQPQEPGSPTVSIPGQVDKRGWLSSMFPRRWQRLHNEVPSQHPGLGGSGGGAAQAAPASASTDYRTKSAAYIAYLQDLKHQIGGKLVSLTPFDIETGPSSGSALSTKRRCGAAGRKCGWTSAVLIAILIVAILTLLIMRGHRQSERSLPPPPRPPLG